METEVLVSCDCGNSWKYDDGRCGHCGSTNREVYYIVRRMTEWEAASLLEMVKKRER